MEKLFVATSNLNKLKEIKIILKDLGKEYEIVCPKDFNDDSEPIEDGTTFKENALIKARYYFNKYHLKTIADDSGICIKYLNDFPGIYSARFMSKYSYVEKNDTILKIMEGVENREATFNCALAYIDENGKEKTYLGVLNGEIAYKQEGEEGFGYDPIFFLKDKQTTTAGLKGYEKNKVSHRYLVLKEWVQDEENK